MTETAATQTHDWKGDAGDRWAANLARLDLMLADFGKAALAAAQPVPGEKALDIGCGSGTSTFALAEAIGPQGRVVGVDISQQLIDLAAAEAASEAAPDRAPIDFLCADAATADMEGGPYDLLFSRFGVMFFEEPVTAFAHMRQALAPDGRLAFVCWRGAAENDWVRLPLGAISHILPQPPANPTAPGPFAFGDADYLRDILTHAGFEQIGIAPFDTPISYGRGDTREAAVDDALDMAMAVGPLSRALADQPPEICDKAAAAVRAAFAERPGETSVLIDGAAWIVTARRGA